MKKKNYAILLALMTAALVGILLIQILWLNKGINEREETFRQRVQMVLANTSQNVREKEQAILYEQLYELRDIIKEKNKFQITPDQTKINKYHIQNQNIVIDETSIALTEGIGSNKDSLNILDVYASNGKNNRLALDRYLKVKGSTTPIEQRVSASLIDSILQVELNQVQLKTAYEFAILNKDSSQTKLHTKQYKQEENYYTSPLFFEDKNHINYYLSLYFPDKSVFIKASIWGQFILAALLMLVVLLVFCFTIYYMNQQRKVSKVKNDFINNITHEFKTPIATISVAVDALKSPVVLRDEEKIKHYAGLIKEENKRLNRQVEMVLRISRLEKNQLDLNKINQDIKQIVQKAVDNIRLIVENRNGIIFEHYADDILYSNVDAFHFGNIILNILDNANKYSRTSPEITVNVYKSNNQVFISIADKGIGMDKTVQKKIFEQFYREESGNIHNIKGHGLGLSYAQKIVALHGGTIEVTSEKNVGSNFIIKIPLINI